MEVDPQKEERPSNPALRQPFHDPKTWFDTVYKHAHGDMQKVPWVRQTVNPTLFHFWLEQRDITHLDGRGLVVGCGLGNDAELLAQTGLHVTAFDISDTAISWCQQRFPSSKVKYQVADLFELPVAWQQSFDFVFDALTIQSIPPHLHEQAVAAIAKCVAPGGTLLIICHGREEEEVVEGPPWPLAKTELTHFLKHDLQEVAFFDQTLAGVRRFLVEYRRPKI